MEITTFYLLLGVIIILVELCNFSTTSRFFILVFMLLIDLGEPERLNLNFLVLFFICILTIITSIFKFLLTEAFEEKAKFITKTCKAIIFISLVVYTILIVPPLVRNFDFNLFFTNLIRLKKFLPI